MPTSPDRPRSNECADFYAPYIAAVEGPLLPSLERDADAWREILAAVPPDREAHRYAPGKWSLREVVGHVTDAERMFCTRAMAFARRDPSHFPSFDENVYVAHSGAGGRPLADLAAELAAVRAATLSLVRSFSGDVWDLRGVAAGSPVHGAEPELDHRGALRSSPEGGRRAVLDAVTCGH